MRAGGRRRPGGIVLGEQMQAQESAQLLVGVPVHELPEILFRPLMGLVSVQQVLEGVLDLVGGDFALDRADEFRVRAEAASQADVEGLHLRAVGQAGQAALQADVADVMLAAGVGAAVDVDAQRLVPEHFALQVRHDLPQAMLGLGDRQVAELVARAGDGAFVELGDFPREPGVPQRPLNFRQVRLRDVGEQVVLLVGGAQAALAVPLRDGGGGEHLAGGDTPGDDRDTDPVEAFLLLALHAQVVLLALALRLQPVDGRLRGPAQALDEDFAELFRAPVSHQELEAGVVATLAVAVVAEYLGHGAADVRNLLRRDGDIEPLGEVGLCAEPAAHAHVEAGLPSALPPAAHRRDAQVVDLRLVAVDRAAGDGDLVLAGQIGKVFIAQKIAGDLMNDRTGIVQLIGFEAGDGAAADVAGDVPAGAGGREAGGAQALDGARDVLNGQPVELEVLARGDVGDVVAIVAGDLGHGAHLGRRQIAAGDLDTQHEVALVGLLLVDAVPSHAREIVRRDGMVSGLRIAQQVRPYVQAVFCLLDRLYIRFGHARLLLVAPHPG